MVWNILIHIKATQEKLSNTHSLTRRAKNGVLSRDFSLSAEFVVSKIKQKSTAIRWNKAWGHLLKLLVKNKTVPDTRTTSRTHYTACLLFSLHLKHLKDKKLPACSILPAIPFLFILHVNSQLWKFEPEPELLVDTLGNHRMRGLVSDDVFTVTTSNEFSLSL